MKTRLRAGDHPLVRVDDGAEQVRIRQVPAAADGRWPSAGGGAGGRLRRRLHRRSADPGAAAAGRVRPAGRLGSASARRGSGAGHAAGHPQRGGAAGPHGRVPRRRRWRGLAAAAARAAGRWQLPWLAVTLGSRGALLHDGDGPADGRRARRSPARTPAAPETVSPPRCWRRWPTARCPARRSRPPCGRRRFVGPERRPASRPAGSAGGAVGSPGPTAGTSRPPATSSVSRRSAAVGWPVRDPGGRHRGGHRRLLRPAACGPRRHAGGRPAAGRLPGRLPELRPVGAPAEGPGGRCSRAGPGQGAARAALRRRGGGLRRGHPGRGAARRYGPTSGPRAATTRVSSCRRRRCWPSGAARW